MVKRRKIVLYHGTCDKYFDSIYQNGIRSSSEIGKESNWPGAKQHDKQLVYLTQISPIMYGLNACAKFKSEASCPIHNPPNVLILRVKVDIDDLYPDTDALSYMKDKSKKRIIYDANVKNFKHLATESLEKFGAVTIPEVKKSQILSNVILYPKTDKLLIHGLFANGHDSNNKLYRGDFLAKGLDILLTQGKEAAEKFLRTMTVPIEEWPCHVRDLL